MQLHKLFAVACSWLQHTVAGRHWIERPGAYRDGRHIPIHKRGRWSGWTIVRTGLTLAEAQRAARLASYAETAVRPCGRAAFGPGIRARARGS